MKRFQIFKTGRHTDMKGNTREWTVEDLDRIVASYKPAEHEAPIVIGHPSTDSPAFGWAEKLEREGDVLYAYPKEVHPEFEKLVEAGTYKNRSIALFPDGRLRHIGFLGGTPPAVTGLKPVEFSAGEATEYSFFQDAGNQDTGSQDTGSQDTGSQGSGNQDTGTQDSEDKHKGNEQKIAELEAEIRKLKQAREKEEAEAFADSLVKAGKIKPDLKGAVTEIIVKLSPARGSEFAASDAVGVLTQFKELLNSMPAFVKSAEFSYPPAPGNSNQALSDRTRLKMAIKNQKGELN